MFNVGDRVWLASCGTEQVTKPCPICYGKLRVTLLLGNGDSVDIDCDTCGNGYKQSRGVVQEYEYVAEATPIVITAVVVEQTMGSEKIEYRCGYTCPPPENLFLTESEALARCAEIVREEQERQATRVEYLKKKAQKSYSWNAGYHLREAKSLEERAKYHREKAVLCKAKSKEKGDG